LPEAIAAKEDELAVLQNAFVVDAALPRICLQSSSLTHVPNACLDRFLGTQGKQAMEKARFYARP
jgi:hypothetical protein